MLSCADKKLNTNAINCLCVVTLHLKQIKMLTFSVLSCFIFFFVSALKCHLGFRPVSEFQQWKGEASIMEMTTRCC